jgi:hypothetical protein
MEAVIRKRSFGAMFLALPMLFFGILISLYGAHGIAEWQSEGAALIVASVALSLTGVAIAGAVLWLWGSLGRNRWALMIGGSASVVSGAVLAAAVLTHVMPCNGPA